MRRLVVTFVVAMLLAACGGSAGAPPAPTATPTVVPTDTPAPSPSPTATAGPSGSGAFVVAGLVSTLDPNGGLPDPSTFSTSFASDIPAIYVPYELASGLAGKVTTTWKSTVASDVVSSFDYPASAPWAYVRLTRPGGFLPGDDQEVLTFEPTGESVTLHFTITGAVGSAATPSPLPSGTSAFTLLRAATASDVSKSAPDPATFTDSFPSTASVIYVVFELRSGLTGTTTFALTANGSLIVQQMSIDYGTSLRWASFHVTSSRGFPVGDYAATVTYTPTGEAQTILFTVK